MIGWIRRITHFICNIYCLRHTLFNAWHAYVLVTHFNRYKHVFFDHTFQMKVCLVAVTFDRQSGNTVANGLFLFLFLSNAGLITQL